MNLDWPSVKRDDTGSWPPANPNWFKQQEMMAQMGPMLGMLGGGGGGSPAPSSTNTVMPFLIKVAACSGSNDTLFSPWGSFKIPAVIKID